MLVGVGFGLGFLWLSGGQGFHVLGVGHYELLIGSGMLSRVFWLGCVGFICGWCCGFCVFWCVGCVGLVDD